jgi:hypothetical protein
MQQYIFVAYIYDLNAILVCTMPSKNDAAMITNFHNILATFAARVYKSTLNATNNKCSTTVEVHIKSNKIDICLVPSHNHRINAAKIPTISTADLTVLAACNVLRTLQITIPTTAIKAANHRTAIYNLCAIINPTLHPSATAPRVGAALEPRVPPATITPSPDTRVLHSTVSNSSAPAALYPQITTTSINVTFNACTCAI